MLLGNLIAGLDVRLSAPGGSGVSTIRICDITEDSRTVMPGSLYVARKGGTSDGRAYIASAIKAGAVAVLLEEATDAAAFASHAGQTPALITPNLPLTLAHVAERFFGEPSTKLTVVGVTGTNGKTTTTYLIHQMLNALGVRCGLIGTVVIDDGVEVAPASMTTPPALELSRTLARMHDAGCRAAVLEVSSHSLHQHRVSGVAFKVGVFTNLTGDHLDYHKTMEAYADAKATLFTMLPAWTGSAGGTAIVNADDPAFARMIRDCTARVWTTSVRAKPASTSGAPSNACIASVTASTRFGSDARLIAPWIDDSNGTGEGAAMHIPMVGEHNVMNSLQAACAVAAVLERANPSRDTGTVVADAGNAGARRILGALAACSAPPGRLECLTSPSDAITVYVDYAHTDDALRTVLSLLRRAMGSSLGAAERSALTSVGTLAVVFGCGGDRDATKRPRMGRVAAELADRIYITSDNPRTEDPNSIIREILHGMPMEAQNAVSTHVGVLEAANSPRVIVQPDREQAIRQSIRDAVAGDIVIIAGKGHEDYQILPAPPDGSGRSSGTVTRAFDDRLVAGAALRERGIQARPPAGKCDGFAEIK